MFPPTDETELIILIVLSITGVILEGCSYLSIVGTLDVEQNPEDVAFKIYNVKTFWFSMDSIVTAVRTLAKAVVAALGI